MEVAVTGGVYPPASESGDELAAALKRVGTGLDVRKSTLPGAGKGLFATTAFAAGRPIVRVMGLIVPWAECAAIKKKDRVFALQPGAWVLDGLYEPENADDLAWDGLKKQLTRANGSAISYVKRGVYSPTTPMVTDVAKQAPRAGAWAVWPADAVGFVPNARVDRIALSDPASSSSGPSANPLRTVVFLRALRDISPGEEILLQSEPVTCGSKERKAVVVFEEVQPKRRARIEDGDDEEEANPPLKNEDAVLERLRAVQQKEFRPVTPFDAFFAATDRQGKVSAFKSMTPMQRTILLNQVTPSERSALFGMLPYGLLVDSFSMLDQFNQSQLMVDLAGNARNWLFGQLDESVQQRILRGVPVAQRMELLNTVTLDDQSSLIPELPPFQQSELLAQLPPGNKIAFLRFLTDLRKKELLDQLSADERQAILNTFAPDERARIENAGSWADDDDEFIEIM